MDALRADPNNDVDELGRPVMLAEAIIYDRCLGTVSAAAVIESLAARFVSVTRQALNKAVVMVKADVKRLFWYEPADVDGYLKTNLKVDERPSCTKKARAQEDPNEEARYACFLISASDLIFAA